MPPKVYLLIICGSLVLSNARCERTGLHGRVRRPNLDATLNISCFQRSSCCFRIYCACTDWIAETRGFSARCVASLVVFSTPPRSRLPKLILAASRSLQREDHRPHEFASEAEHAVVSERRCARIFFSPFARQDEVLSK